MKNPENNKGLRRSGVRYIVLSFLALLLQAVIFFISAGRIDLPRAWFFFIASLAYYIIAILIYYKFNLELLNRRGEKRQDVKSWDMVLAPLYLFIGHYAIFVIIGLEYRFLCLSLSIPFSAFIPFFILGFVLFFTSIIIGNYAMWVNPHFETFIRIQEDREHQVIATGPYKVIRHPGYAGAFLYHIAIPFIMGSVFGLFPAGLAILILIIRTSLEDKTLRNELDGYSEYAKKVKYRLIPGIW